MAGERSIGLVLDRTAVLFLGVAVGIAIGFAFARNLRDAVAPTLAPGAPAATPVAPPARGTASPTRPAPGMPPLSGLSVSEGVLSPGVANAIAQGRRVRVGVLGDSFGDGLWSGLYNQLPKKDGFEVLRLSQQSTGFTRYASLNLEEKLKKQLAEGPVDIAVISFGANDTQGVAAGGHVWPLLSPGWQAAIGERITRYVGLLKAQGAQVYWVGLPVMREAGYEADIVGLNRFYADLMAKIDVPFIETRSRSVDAGGAYAAYLPDPVTGAPRLMRANDGIHMSMGGYKRLTAPLADHIASRVAAAKRAAEPAAAMPEAETPSAEPPDAAAPDGR